MKKIFLSLIVVLPFLLQAQTIEVTHVELLTEANGNGYIDPAEVVTITLSVKNNSTTYYQNFAIEENTTDYQAAFMSAVFVQNTLLPGDSMMVDVTYLTDVDLNPWNIGASLAIINSGGIDTSILVYEIPVVFYMECSDLNLISLDVYTDVAYPGIQVEIENNSNWDIQYPGLLFSTADPYIQFPETIGYYYVLPNDFTYPMWESITVSPYTPENYTVYAILTFITIDSVVMCDIPISFVLNPTSTSISEEETDGLIIYPNPATDWVELSGLNNSSTKINIFSIDGSVVQSEILLKGQKRINIQSLHSGIYLIESWNQENSALTFKQLIVIE
ncbi:MAG: T9SS type A sorting domain-containing protein [Bacteroidales bacterium]|nr:T9SS type A sorting domain-containing protein [Bacteroidales bacterium]MCF8459012.1 T9SS type A sorting domain-containing protein [Bacteroidales bacterium]